MMGGTNKAAIADALFLQRAQRTGCSEHGNMMTGSKYSQAAHVIDMLMRHKNRLNRLRLNLDAPKHLCQLLGAAPGVYQNSGIGRTDIIAVA